MEDLKIYGISFFALMTSMSTVNPVLQAIVLTLTIVYTAIGIYKRLKNKKQ